MGKILYVNGQQTYVETRIPQQTGICPIATSTAQRETHFVTGSGRNVYRPEVVAQRLYQSGMAPVQAWVAAQSLINRNDGLVDPQAYFDETPAMKFANFVATGFFGTADYRDFHLAEVLREAGIEGEPSVAWQKLENLNPANHNEAQRSARYALLQLVHPLAPASERKFPKELLEKTTPPSSGIEVAEAAAIVVFTALTDLDANKVEFDLLSRNLRSTLSAAELAQLEDDLRMLNNLSKELKGYFARGTYNNIPSEVRDILESSNWVTSLLRAKNGLRDAVTSGQGVAEAWKTFTEALNFARIILHHSTSYSNGRSAIYPAQEIQRLNASLAQRLSSVVQSAEASAVPVVGNLGVRTHDMSSVREAVRRAQEAAIALDDTFPMVRVDARLLTQAAATEVAPLVPELAAARAETPAVVAILEEGAAASVGTPASGGLKIAAILVASALAGLGITYWIKHREN